MFFLSRKRDLPSEGGEPVRVCDLIHADDIIVARTHLDLNHPSRAANLNAEDLTEGWLEPGLSTEREKWANVLTSPGDAIDDLSVVSPLPIKQ